MKKLVALFLLIMPMSLFSQNIDVDILKTIHSPEPLSSDDFFRVVSNFNIYVLPVPRSLWQLSDLLHMMMNY